MYRLRDVRKDCVAHNIELKNDKAGVFSNTVLCAGTALQSAPKMRYRSAVTGRTIRKYRKTRLNPGDVLNVIRFRRTIRQFHDREIPKKYWNRSSRQAG